MGEMVKTPEARSLAVDSRKGLFAVADSGERHRERRAGDEAARGLFDLEPKRNVGLRGPVGPNHGA
jgi:hypothetical protein